MTITKSLVKELIEIKDYSGIKNLLNGQPYLANEGIGIPHDNFCTQKAHPLHRLCDAVFSKHITEKEAIKFAGIFLNFGANIDGGKIKGEGTPLLAAASLHAEQLGIFYIEQGADIFYTFQKNGESALHWASFCGSDNLVNKLIHANAPLDMHDNTYHTTPLGWAIQALQVNDNRTTYKQVDCIKLLLKNGAATKRLDKVKCDYLFLLSKSDSELQDLLP